MSKINKNEKKSRRIGFKLLVAAAIIASLTMTAFAAEAIFGAGDWFRGILNDELQENKKLVAQENLDVTVQENIGENQIEVINEMGQVFEEKSYTSQGTTITMTAAYADANLVHMYLQVEVPEGTVLPDGIRYAFFSHDSFQDQESAENRAGPLELAADAPYEIGGFSYDLEVLADTDPTDNKKDFQLTIYRQSGMEMALNDGVNKYWHIDGIYEQVTDMYGDEDGFVLLAPGEFALDISLANDVEVVDLDVEGLTYGGPRTRTWTHDSECIDLCQEKLTGEKDPETGLPIHSESWEYSVTARSLRISPLSVDWACEFACSNKSMIPGLSYKIVMKDGTSPVGRDIGGSEGENWSSGTIMYDIPIDVDEIDYVLIGDEELGQTHKVYLP